MRLPSTAYLFNYAEHLTASYNLTAASPPRSRQQNDLNMLKADQLTCERGNRELFRGLSFSLNAADVLQVHGANGSGKTTLLRVLANLSMPTKGRVYWHGEEITSGPKGNRETYTSNLCYIGHVNGIKGDLSPLENLQFWQSLSGNPDLSRTEEALFEIGLGGFERVRCETLSTGQRRRVALSRLSTTAAKLWLLDEPFTALDSSAIQWIGKLFQTHTACGGIVIFTSHQPSELTIPVKKITLEQAE